MADIVYIIRRKKTKEPYVRRNEYVPYNCEDMETQLHKARFYVRKGTALQYCNPELEEIVKVKLEVIE